MNKTHQIRGENQAKLLSLSAVFALTITNTAGYAAEPGGNAAAQPLTSQSQAAIAPTAQATAGSASSAAVNPLTTGDTGTDTVTTNGVQAGEIQTGKVIIKPGQPISINMETEDIQPTDDVELARKQAAAYPDNAEASFVLAVALTRTSHVEEALKEVQHARRLAREKGGADYFDKMISTYEKMLESCPDDNRVRYDLAWAYYMKAYLLMQSAKKQAAANPIADAQSDPAAAAQTQEAVATKTQPVKTKSVNATVANQVLSMIDPKLSQNLPAQGKVSSQTLPRLKGALEQTPPSAVPQVKIYYEAALKNLDDLLARKPDDIWARVYRAHLCAEYTGDLSAAMVIWKECQKKSPQNPAAYFFLGEGYLKQGNLKECFANITRAIALRALGN
jgi:tetratricopeptide (TPR) repeat protein